MYKGIQCIRVVMGCFPGLVEKVSLLIRNGLLVTMDRGRRVVERGYIAVDGDTIVAVEKGDPGGKYVGEETIDAGGGVVLPGFICVHTHLYGALLRASPWFSVIDPPTDFQQNLQRIWWSVDELIGYEEAYAGALAACIDFLRTGTTLFFDTLSSPNAIDGVLDWEKKAVLETGIRGILAFEATERHSSDEGLRGLGENERFIRENNDLVKERVTGAISLHASFTVSDELFIKARELASKYNALLTIHVEEGLIDVYHNIERYGLRPIERMEKLGFLGRDVVMAHVVQAIRDELLILKKHDVAVAHNAMSNMLNAVGVAPVPEMMELGLKVGIGNDGYVFDVFENMRATYLLHKVHKRDPRVLSPVDVIEMATIGAARVLGVDKWFGSLEPGKKADIVVVKPEYTPTPINPGTVYGHIVNTFRGLDVDTVVVGGEVVVRDKRFVKLDVYEKIGYVHRVVEKLWDKLLSEGVYQYDILEIKKPLAKLEMRPRK